MKKPQNNKPTIAFLTHDWAWGTDPLQPNGCAWYRCKLPSDELNKRGWSTAIGFPVYSEKNNFGMLYDGDKAVHGWDIIVFKLLMQKDILIAMRKAISRGQKIVVDVDDWHDGLSPANRAYRETHPELNPTSNREIYAEIILEATAVITSTPFLFNYYASKRDNVFLVRNGIDLDRWTQKQFRFNKTRRIGWVGATHWRSNDLEQLAPFFGSYLSLRNCRFHHSGHNDKAPAAAELLGVEKQKSSTSFMVPILEYPTLFRDIDIGIIPLNNIPFNHAKSFIKGLEYAAAGLPFISSYSPEYEILAQAGVGRVAHNESEWIYNFDRLLDNNTLLEEVKRNLSNLPAFSMSQRGDDWDATMKVILEKI